MAEDIAALAAVGIDLRDKPLSRLEWDLAHQLKDHVRDLRDAGRSSLPDAPVIAGRAALAAAQAAGQAGYPVAESVAKLATSYDEMAKRAEAADEERREMEERFQALATAIRDLGRTRKARRRVNRVLREMNIQLDVPEEEEPEA